MSSTGNVAQKLPALSVSECRKIVLESQRDEIAHSQQENLQLIDFSLRNVGEEILGFLGGYLSLTVCVQTNADELPTELKFFIKSEPFDNENKLKTVQELGVFNKELRLFKELLSQIGGTRGQFQWRPKAYYFRNDLIVLEDLTNRNYEVLPGRTIFAVPHVIKSLESIARLHAESLAFEIHKLNGKSINDFHENILFATIVPENTWFMAGLAAVKHVATHHPRFIKFAGKLNNFSELISKTVFHRLFNFGAFRSALCHMDLWKNNIMFRFEKTETGTSDYSKPLHAILVDYQLMRYCPPALDTMIFIHSTTNQENRRSHFDEYLQHYYKIFSETLQMHNLRAEDVIGWDEFRKSCDYFRICGAAFSSVFYPCTLVPDGYFNQLDKVDKSLQYNIMNIDRNDFILDFVNNDQFYADIVLDSYEDFLELLLEKN